MKMPLVKTSTLEALQAEADSQRSDLELVIADLRTQVADAQHAAKQAEDQAASSIGVLSRQKEEIHKLWTVADSQRTDLTERLRDLLNEFDLFKKDTQTRAQDARMEFDVLIENKDSYIASLEDRCKAESANTRKARAEAGALRDEAASAHQDAASAHTREAELRATLAALRTTLAQTEDNLRSALTRAQDEASRVAEAHKAEIARLNKMISGLNASATTV